MSWCVFVCVFILFGLIWASWTCSFIIFINWRNILAIIASNSLSVFPSPFSLRFKLLKFEAGWYFFYWLPTLLFFPFSLPCFILIVFPVAHTLLLIWSSEVFVLALVFFFLSLEIHLGLFNVFYLFPHNVHIFLYIFANIEYIYSSCSDILVW